MTNAQLKKLILQDTYFLLGDYRIGDIVRYLPTIGDEYITEHLIVSSIRIETHDLCNNEYELPKYVYSFENMDLGAYEDQLELFNK